MINIYPFIGSRIAEAANIAYAVVECQYAGKNPANALVTAALLAEHAKLFEVWADIPRGLKEEFGRAHDRYQLVAVKNMDTFETVEDVALSVCTAALAIMSYVRALRAVRDDLADISQSGVQALPAERDRLAPVHRKNRK